MENLQLRAEARSDLGKTPQKKIRNNGKIPAVVYGHGVPTRSLTIDAGQFQKLWQKAGETTLVDLMVGEEAAFKVLIQDVQLHPLKHMPIHVDFHQVRMSEKITAEIPLEFVGEAAAVKELGGVLVKSLDTIKVECLPADLIHELTIDISSLKTFEDVIRVSDVAIPATLTVLENPGEVIATVSAPRSEAELAALEEKVEEKVEAVETVEKKKSEEDVEVEAAAEEKK
jgi:large subunit ribosomal protein L25